jgi:hypothetical protein
MELSRHDHQVGVHSWPQTYVADASIAFDFPTLVWVVSVLMQALDKILEAVVGNCQEAESPIPFNDLPSLGDVE